MRAIPLATPFAVYALLRVPSFLEPHWYTDEAGYATTARSLLLGKRLYAEIWNNKPPLHLWTLAADILAFGTSEAGLHVVTFLSGLAALGAVLYVGPTLLGRWRTAVALLLAAVALGSPLFDAELALPESLLIAPAAWAGAIVLRRVCSDRPAPRLRWAVVAGACAAAAMAYQQTAVADAAALGLILALSLRVRHRQVFVYALTAIGLTAAWVIAAIVTAGAGTVGFALAGFYIPYTQAMLPTSTSGLLGHAALLAVSLGLICAGAFATRRADARLWAPWVWAGATLLVNAAAQQPYAHFLTPSVVPVALVVAGVRLPVALRDRRLSFHRPEALRTWRTGLGAAALVAGVVVAGRSASIGGVDWMPSFAANGTNLTRDIGNYYRGAIGTLTGAVAVEEWQESFDARVAGDRDVADWVVGHGLSTRSTVVWSSDAWPYLMANLAVIMPTAPIYNNEVLFGNQGQVATLVHTLDPEVIITSDDSVQGFPEVQPLLQQAYRAVDRAGWDTVWLRNDQVLVETSSG